MRAILQIDTLAFTENYTKVKTLPQELILRVHFSRSFDAKCLIQILASLHLAGFAFASHFRKLMLLSFCATRGSIAVQKNVIRLTLLSFT